ncbi:MAG TPA: NAD(P)/FAD-dependent oxidoreductase [Rhodanobacteraceae bacterium]|nr:NAD(P)/FAD-dependent oxidoreductase [Rhodanobacteraceae bacterium]
MSKSGLPSVTIIGAGLVGSLLATLLAQRGFDVEVFERRPDPRVRGTGGGRSINLALAERGLNALRSADIADQVLAQAVMMRGRMVHALDGSGNLQRYGLDDSEVIRSVSRGDLNLLLLDASEHAGARLCFDAALAGADFATGSITLASSNGSTRRQHAGLLLGCDGAGSALRAAMSKAAELGERIEPLGHGYKELEIPAAIHLQNHHSGPDAAGTRLCSQDRKHERRRRSVGRAPWMARVNPFFAAGHRPDSGSPLRGVRNDEKNQDMSTDQDFSSRFALEPHALHIWPRGHYMCIALPNTEGNFTVTLFLPNEGQHPSFASLPDVPAARAFFEQQFSDALALMPTFDQDWNTHPVGQLATLYLDRWHLDHRAVLLGDAAHAIVPFHGQGMNAGFEDAAVLAMLLAEQPDEPAAVFAKFESMRKPNADAIAAMSLANYIEMRDGVADPHYLLKRELAALLTEHAPRHFMSRYRMVSFTSIPYATCVARERAQTRLMESMLAGHDSLAGIDPEAAAAQARRMLPELPEDA